MSRTLTAAALVAALAFPHLAAAGEPWQQGANPAQTGYYQQQQQPQYYQQPAYQYPQYQQQQYQQQYYQQQYYSQYPGYWTQGKPVQQDAAGKARLGRTLGGAAGIAAGSFGGAAIASALIKATGIAAMGPIAPLLVGTAITAGGAFLGAKGLSLLGQATDRALGPDATFTVLGGVAGAVAGFALLPALGPFAGPAGRILGAALGGIAGGLLGKLLAPKLDKFATAPNIYGATGALLGGIGFGPLGAVAGAAGGYALGSVFDKNFFVDRSGSIRSTVQDARDHFADMRDRFQDYRHTVTDWVHTRTDRFGDRLRSRWPYYDHDSGFYDDYSGTRQWVNDNYYASSTGTGSGGGYDYASESGHSGNLAQYKAAYWRALEDFNRLNQYGTPSQRADAARRVQEAQQSYQRAKYQAGQGY